MIDMEVWTKWGLPQISQVIDDHGDMGIPHFKKPQMSSSTATAYDHMQRSAHCGYDWME